MEKKGHFSRECRAPKKNTGKNGRNVDNQNNSGNSQGNSAFIIKNNADIEVLIADCNTTWIMDSGASRHMCPHKEFFASLQEVKNITVRLGNNDELAVKGIGTVHIDIGHINKKSLKEVFSKELVENLKLTETEDFFCESCVYAKQHKLKFSPIERQVTKPGELIYNEC